MTISAEQAQAEFPSLLSRAEEGEVIAIERDGHPVVELRPAHPAWPASAKRIFGMLEGQGIYSGRYQEAIKTPYEAEINEMFYGK